MGRIKTQGIKATSQEIFNLYKEELTADFYENKVILAEKTDISSKKLKNVIAGYLTRLVKATANN